MNKQGLRFNQGKPKLSMVLEAYEALCGLAEVLMFGEIKYDRGNWMQGLSWTEIADSQLRHLGQFLSPNFNDLDDESKKHHAFHNLSNALFLAQYVATKTGRDDRVDLTTDQIKQINAIAQKGLRGNEATHG